MTNTKNRILDAAERIFAEHGFAGASLRAITADAGVNLAAVNYHFVSKEALMIAVLARRLEPMNNDRLALLDRCEKEANGNPPPLDGLVRAFIVPLLCLGRAPAPNGPSLSARLLGRMFAEPSAPVRRMCAEQVRSTAARFAAAFKRALPHLPAEEIFWRLYLSIGIVMHVLASAPMVEVISNGLCSSRDTVAINQRVVDFIIAGLQAPRRSPRRARAGKDPRPRRRLASRSKTSTDDARTIS